MLPDATSPTNSAFCLPRSLITLFIMCFIRQTSLIDLSWEIRTASVSWLCHKALKPEHDDFEFICPTYYHIVCNGTVAHRQPESTHFHSASGFGSQLTTSELEYLQNKQQNYFWLFMLNLQLSWLIDFCNRLINWSVVSFYLVKEYKILQFVIIIFCIFPHKLHIWANIKCKFHVWVHSSNRLIVINQS